MQKKIYPCDGPLQQLYPSWVRRALGSKVHSLPICASLISARVTSFYLQQFSAYIFSLDFTPFFVSALSEALTSDLASINQEASVPDFRSSPVSRTHARRRLWNASIVSMLLFQVIKVVRDVSNASYQPFLG